MLSLDKRRAFGLWFFIAIAAHLALYFNDVSYFILEPDGDALAIFAMAGSVGMLTYMTPLFASLPFATGFCADWNSGFAGAASMRSGRLKYLLSKSLACALSGGLVPALSTLVFVLFLSLRFPTDPTIMSNFAMADPYNQALMFGAPVGLMLYYAGLVVMQFLAGACWSMMGLAFSAFFPNVLLTLCVPLAAYRLSMEVYYWLELPYWLNLPLLQDCTVELNYILTLLTGFAVFGGLSIILCAIFCIRAGRRLRYA